MSTYNREIGNLLNSKSALKDFLRADPNDLYFFSKQSKEMQRLFKKEYYSHLFVENKEMKDLYGSIIENTSKSRNSTFILEGYKGNGKTVFVRYIRDRLKGETRCAYSPVVITVDDTVRENKTFDNSIQEYIVKTLTADLDNGLPIMDRLLNVFFRDDSFHRTLLDKYDSENKIYEIFEKLENLICEQKENTSIRELQKMASRVKADLSQLSLIDMFTFFIIILHSINSISEKNIDKTIVIFDNLDVIVSFQEVQKVIDAYVSFCQNISNLFPAIEYTTSEGTFSKGFFSDYSFIFVLRETTKARLHYEHLRDHNQLSFKIEEVTSLTPKNRILEKRLKYLLNNCDVVWQVKEYAKELLRFSEEDISNSRPILGYDIDEDDEPLTEDDKRIYFKLFNFDYRRGVGILCDTLLGVKEDGAHRHFMDEYDRIKQSQPRGRVGADGYRMHTLFTVMQEKNNEITLYEKHQHKDKNGNGAINIARMVLVILRERKLTGQPDANVCLRYIFRKLDGLCEIKSLCRAIYEMYDIRNRHHNNESMNHLITFSKMKDDNVNSLIQQSENYENGDSLPDEEYDFVRITEAGMYFLEKMIVHFEYFSIVFSGRYNSYLFDVKNLQYTNPVTKRYEFEEVIDTTLGVVRKLSSDLHKNFYGVYRPKQIKDGKTGSTKEFLQSSLAFNKNPKSTHETDNLHSGQSGAMFHAERVIHAHIGYLDVFRRYACACENDNEKKVDINMKIVGYIKNYMMLLGYDFSAQDESKKFKLADAKTMISYNSIYLCPLYHVCIIKIEASKYRNCDIKISRDEGKNLRMNVK